ncbi:MAG: cation:proton antiporter [archaeon]
MDVPFFAELTAIIVTTLAVSGALRLLKQPLIIGYILSGAIIGPAALNLVRSHDAIANFSQLGVVFLLFIVGLNLNPRVIRDVGKVALVTGVGQVAFTVAFALLLCKLIGFTLIESLYVSIALAFSSTIIIMKLLSDKKEMETLFARISIGFLIVQDIIAIVLLVAISSLAGGANVTLLITETLFRGLLIMIALVAVSLYALPKIVAEVAKSQEFLFLFSLGWCLSVATAFHYANFSIEAGALLAGIALSISPYHYEISSRMRPLRDFFIILFFIWLGSQMQFANFAAQVPIGIALSALVLFGNPLIVMTLMGLLNYTKRNSFKAGLTVAQISEFSLIIVALGVKLGHLSAEFLSLLTFVGLLTMGGSTYMILYSDRLYGILSKRLSIFERKGRKIDEHRYHKDHSYDIILFGYDRIGYDILESLKKIKRTFLVIDYDPELIVKLSKEGYDCKYGDANDSELLNDLNMSDTKMVVSTIPTIDTNLLIINKVKEANDRTIIAIVSHQIDDALRLYDAGATYVILPHFLGGRYLSTMIERNKLDINKFLRERALHISDIKARKERGHEHPRHEKHH